MIDKLANFKAYDSIELLENFASDLEIQAYRNRRIERYIPVVDFVKRRSAAHGSKLSVAEVGSGSSALLYAMAQAEALKMGVGIELSKSRYEFAEK